MSDGAAAQIYDGDEIDLRRYVEVVWRRRNAIIAVTVAAVVAALIVSLVPARQWQAKTTIMVPEPPKVEQGQVVGGIQATSPAVVYSQETYARLLRSTVLLERVIRTLGLNVKPEDLGSAVTARPIRDTRLIEISVRGSDPAAAEAIAGALAEALVEYDRQVISAELTQARRFVESQLVRAREELQAREQLLKEFNQRENLAALEAEVNRRLTQLTNLRQANEQNKIALGVAERQLAQLNKELATLRPLRLTSTSTQANTLNTSVAAQLRAKLADLESQRAALLERYTAAHPSVAALGAQIDETRRELAKAAGYEPRAEILQTNAIREQLESQKASLEVEAAGLLARDRLLSQAIARDERDYRELNGRLVEKRAQLNQLAREAETARNTYATISGKATEAIVAEGMKSGFVRVVDRAVAHPVARGTVMKIALAAVLGLMLGAMLAFLIEYFGVASSTRASLSPVLAQQEPAHPKET